jgi:hypothetical protein
MVASEAENRGIYVDGKRLTSSASEFSDVFDPSTGEVIARADARKGRSRGRRLLGQSRECITTTWFDEEEKRNKKVDTLDRMLAGRKRAG